MLTLQHILEIIVFFRCLNNLMDKEFLPEADQTALVSRTDPRLIDTLHKICKTSVARGATEKYRHLMCQVEAAASLTPLLDQSINILLNMQEYLRSLPSQASAKKSRAKPLTKTVKKKKQGTKKK